MFVCFCFCWLANTALCRYEFQWSTCAVCPGANPCAESRTGDESTASPVGKSTAVPTARPKSTKSSKGLSGGAIFGVLVVVAFSLVAIVMLYRHRTRVYKAFDFVSTANITPRMHYAPSASTTIVNAKSATIDNDDDVFDDDDDDDDDEEDLIFDADDRRLIPV
jgi:hypothetical protein